MVVAYPIPFDEGELKLPGLVIQEIVAGRFTGLRVRVILHLLQRRRDEYWRTHGRSRQRPAGPLSVPISYNELALGLEIRPSGKLRAAVQELVQGGVLAVASRGVGRRPSAYVLRPDTASWTLR